MPWLNNGRREVLVTPEIYEKLVATGEIVKFTNATQKITGSGPANKIALLLHQNGLGDDVHAMPGLFAKVSEGYEVHVWGRAFNRAMYETLGCRFHEGRMPEDFALTDVLRPEFGAIWSLKNWCINHDEATDGDVTLDRFDQFAQLIETTAPHEFSWLEALLTPEIVMQTARIAAPRIAIAGQSTAPVRSLHSDFELRDVLRAEGYSAECVGRGRGYRELTSLEEMIAYLLSVDLVVGVDSGITALALALKRPVFAIFWGTDPQTIARQFDRYHEQRLRLLVGMPAFAIAHECQHPCSFLPARGRENGKCQDVADCSKDLTPERVSRLILSSYPVLTKPL